MLVIALCPYCARGRVRAADKAVGTTVTCPDCRADFVFIPTDEPAVAAAGSVTPFSSGMLPAVHAGDTAPPKPKRKKSASPEPNEPVIVSAPPSKALDETLPNAAPLPPQPDSPPDPARTPALIAATLGGVGLACSQIPDYGRLVCAGLCLLGLVLAGFALLGAEQGRRWPGVAAGLSAVGLLLSVLLPTWLGQTTWLPDRGLAPDKPTAVGFDGETTPADDWIDATKAEWMKDGVRVTLVEVRRGPVELIGGPKKQRKKSKEDVLQVVLEVANDGRPAPVKFAGWTSATPATLTDMEGRVIPTKVFEAGWQPPAFGSHTLTTGLSVQYVLYFDPTVAAETTRGKLALPLTALGGSGDPIRFVLPLTVYQPARTGGGVK